MAVNVGPTPRGVQIARREGSPRSVITVDGPAGSGKTTCGRLAALELGVGFISSGVYFRAATYKALEEGIDLSDGEALSRLAQRLEVAFLNEPKDLRVLLAGEDRTDVLKDPDVTSRVRLVAENLEVRRILAAAMRARSDREPLLAEGRDMGTVVFPDAAIKFFLDADLACRARRRRLELLALKKEVDEGTLREEIAARDHRDSTRPASPLTVPEGAEVIDTSGLAVDQVVARIVGAVRERGLRF